MSEANCLSCELLRNQYEELEKSVVQIADEQDTYPNRILRALKKCGIKIRSRKKAQLVALKKGRSIPPMLGQKRSPAEKNRIADGVSTAYKMLSPEEKERRREASRESWLNKPDYELRELRSKSASAARKAAERGSKLEQFLLAGLKANGYQVQFHVERFVQNERLQMDLVLTDQQIVVEIDGPSHFLPIYGEDRLATTKQRDSQKNGLLAQAGYKVIRLQTTYKTFTKRKGREVLTVLLTHLKEPERLEQVTTTMFS